MAFSRKCGSAHVFSLSSISSFLFLCRWCRLTRRKTMTKIVTKATAEAPIMISNRLSTVDLSLRWEISDERKMKKTWVLLHFSHTPTKLQGHLSCSYFDPDWVKYHLFMPSLHHKGAANLHNCSKTIFSIFVFVLFCLKLNLSHDPKYPSSHFLLLKYQQNTQ